MDFADALNAAIDQNRGALALERLRLSYANTQANQQNAALARLAIDNQTKIAHEAIEAHLQAAEQRQKEQSEIKRILEIETKQRREDAQRVLNILEADQRRRTDVEKATKDFRNLLSYAELLLERTEKALIQSKDQA